MTSFIRHYVEMLITMFAGMGVFAVAADPEAWAAGPYLLGMAAAMSVPMVAWMRFRGHGWAASGEMTAAMFIPTFAALLLLEAGVLADTHAALMVQHVAMFPAMLIAMLLRRDHYTHDHALAR